MFHTPVKLCSVYRQPSFLRQGAIFVPSMQYNKGPNINRYQRDSRAWRLEMKKTRKAYAAEYAALKKEDDGIQLRLYKEHQRNRRQRKAYLKRGKQKRIEKHVAMLEEASKKRKEKLFRGSENRQREKERKKQETQFLIDKLREERKFWYTDENQITEDLFQGERSRQNEPVGWWVRRKKVSHINLSDFVRKEQVLQDVGLGDLTNLQELGLNLPQGLSSDNIDDADWESDSDDEFGLMDPIRKPLYKPNIAKKVEKKFQGAKNALDETDIDNLIENMDDLKSNKM